ncbi:hypothetical protein [Klebsiella pneumoniae]|uniref:hypothetical protein n=1 Tax=Klebsiella pneumoniae TaxID=573 RepID=UPI0034D2DDE8
MSNENNANLTLAELLTHRCVEFSASPKAVEIIDQGIEKMFKDLVSDAFRSYGDFGKIMGEAFKAALPANVDSILEVGRYNELVTNALRAKWQSSGIADDMVRKAEEALTEVMTESAVPKRVRLSKLLESFIEEHQEQASREGWEKPDVRCDEDGKFLHIYFGKEEKQRGSSYLYSSSERSKYDLENSIAARLEEGKDEDGHPVYRIYSAKLEDKAIQHIVSLDLIRDEWERYMVALYYGQADLVFDCDPEDYSYPNGDY